VGSRNQRGHDAGGQRSGAGRPSNEVQLLGVGRRDAVFLISDNTRRKKLEGNLQGQQKYYDNVRQKR